MNLAQILQQTSGGHLEYVDFPCHALAFEALRPPPLQAIRAVCVKLRGAGATTGGRAGDPKDGSVQGQVLQALIRTGRKMTFDQVVEAITGRKRAKASIRNALVRLQRRRAVFSDRERSAKIYWHWMIEQRLERARALQRNETRVDVERADG